jgi:Protein of unknown function (DUF4013)
MQPNPYGPAGAAAAPAQYLTPGPAASEGVSVIRGVKWVFESPDWKNNLLLGIVFMIIPIVGPLALSGWMCEVHQRLVRRHPNPVPKIDFGDFGSYITRGIAVFLVGLILGLPIAFIFYFLGAAVAFGSIAAGAALDEPLVSVGVAAVAGLVVALFLFMFTVVINAAQTRAELTEDLGSALSLGKVLGYAKATFGIVLIKNISFMFVGFGIVLCGLLLCYFGIYPAIVVLQIAALHLRYQIYMSYLSKGGEPIALKAPQQIASEARLGIAAVGPY